MVFLTSSMFTEPNPGQGRQLFPGEIGFSSLKDVSGLVGGDAHDTPELYSGLAQSF